MADEELAEAINQLAQDVRSLNETATMIADQLSGMRGDRTKFGVEGHLESIKGVLDDILYEVSA